MSSKTVRDIITPKITTLVAPIPVYDMSDQGRPILPENKKSPWVGLQFVGGDEEVRSIGGGNGPDDPNPKTCWRETGLCMVHIVTPTGIVTVDALQIAESVRYGVRGFHIDGYHTVSVSPPTDQEGAAIQIDGPWHGWTVAMEYYLDFFQ